MRKILLMLFLVVSTIVMAQQKLDLNRDFNLSGKLWAYTETETGEDAIVAADGARWHLTNEFVAGRNHVKFWISMPDIEEDMFFTRWSADDVEIVLIIGEDGKKNYYVNDTVFNNLMISEFDKGYLIRNCSVLLDM